MKTYAPSSTNRLALASAMPLDPPVMTATLPSSFPMTFPSGSIFGSSGDAPENLEIGLPASGVECGSAHIGGAKSIRLDDGRQPRRSVSAVRNWAALAGMGYHDRPCYPHTRGCSMCWTRALEGA